MELLKVVKGIHQRFNPDLQIEGILFTMDNCRYNNAKRNKQAIKTTYGSDIRIFEQTIPRTESLAIQLTSYDELLGLEETPEKSMNQVVEIDLAKLYPFKNHPFHVNDDEKMAETVESIKTYGVLTPALVRPRPDGGYEMISGHRRKRGCELCGKTTLPALVRNYTDDEAVIIMVDSNIQRENLLPSEKAHAYKMKYDGRTVQRYIRLAALSDALLEYVDNNKIPMIVGEKLSYLKPEEQGWLLEVITNSSIFPTKQQAEQLKECSANGKLNQSYIYAVLLKKESSKINVTIPAKKIGNYFPETYSKEQIEEVIFMLLDKWKENKEGVADAEDTV